MFTRCDNGNRAFPYNTKLVILANVTSLSVSFSFSFLYLL